MIDRGTERPTALGLADTAPQSRSDTGTCAMPSPLDRAPRRDAAGCDLTARPAAASSRRRAATAPRPADHHADHALHGGEARSSGDVWQPAMTAVWSAALGCAAVVQRDRQFTSRPSGSDPCCDHAVDRRRQLLAADEVQRSWLWVRRQHSGQFPGSVQFGRVVGLPGRRRRPGRRGGPVEHGILADRAPQHFQGRSSASWPRDVNDVVLATVLGTPLPVMFIPRSSFS